MLVSNTSHWIQEPDEVGCCCVKSPRPVVIQFNIRQRPAEVKDTRSFAAGSDKPEPRESVDFVPGNSGSETSVELIEK
jgi:hypothetical protein